MTAEQLEALSKAATQGVETTGYKYFGDYELSEDQWAAVDALVEFARFVTEALRQGQLILVDDAAVERAAKRKFPSRWNWPPNATEGDVQTKIDSICGCAGKYNCDCVSVFNRACSEMWFDHNTAIAAMGGK